jgi:glucuronate isomerase
MNFFDENILLGNNCSKEIYKNIKDLPIIDYHCHLNENEIAADKIYSDIGELWLSGDHYKWRAMRLCGIDEFYITGKSSYKEKFLKYAEILPKLTGNPLYYWTHMELKEVFNITRPLNKDTAEDIYQTANENLKNLSVQKILKRFNVEYIATTDDSLSGLNDHKIYNGARVAPTFRPDKIFRFEEEYIKKLGITAGITIKKLEDLKAALIKRLDFFIEKGCRIADHGMDFLPSDFIDEAEAERLFKKVFTLTNAEKHKLFSHLMLFLGKIYKERKIVMQLHFGTMRNINDQMFSRIGADAGFDVIRANVDTDRLAAFLNRLDADDALPKTVLYTLNPNALSQVCAISGAFKDVMIGPAWWFNDTVEGIKKHLSTVAEYAALGTNLGMVTDSRSFTSYVRFDFFRRILSDFIGGFADRGEYDMDSAIALAKDISYYNAKEFLNI